MDTNSPLSAVRPIERRFLRLKGPDATRYLQGMLTADVAKASAAASEAGRPAGGRAYLLDAKGKAKSEIVFLCLSKEEILLSLPAAQADGAATALDAYIIADDVQLEVLGEAPYATIYRVPDSPFASIPTLAPNVPDAKDRLAVVAEEAWGLRVRRTDFGDHDEEWWVRDASQIPRHEGLDDAAWASLRIARGVAEWGPDLGTDSLVLEFPVQDAISFHKGCYIGQEVVARATYRGKMTRGLCRFTASASLEVGYVHAENEPDKPVGKLTTVEGNKGLGLLRFAPLDAGSKLVQIRADGGRTLIENVEVLLGRE